MNIQNVLVECSIENLRDELFVPRLQNKHDMSFVPPKFTYIKELIPVVLDLYDVEYAQWASAFRDAAQANNLLHHIDVINIDDDTPLWREQDAIVLSWIYATISPYLLVRLDTETRGAISAMNAWELVRDMCEQYTTTVNTRKRRFIDHENNQGIDVYLDSISKLPDDLLVHVLSLVADMKTAGRTCVLSKRWTRVWTHLKDLDFEDPEICSTLNFTWHAQPEMGKFVDRVNRVISANQAPYLDLFRIKFPVNRFYAAEIDNWLKFAFDKEVGSLDLDFLDICHPPIHFSNIFSVDPALILNTTLTSFQLKSATIKGPFLQWLLTNCVNLQHLLLHSCKANTDDAAAAHHRRLVVSSPQLRHVEFYHTLKSLNIQVLCLSAPNLTSFIIYESKFEVEYRSVPSLVDATFGWLYCQDIFQDQDSLSGFSSQLEKLSMRWHMVDIVYTQFPNFANVQQLEIVSTLGHGDLIRSTSLIQACPLLHTFKLKMMCCYKLEMGSEISAAADYAQEDAIRSHQHLKVVEYLGYHGCASAAELAVCLARHALMLQRFIFDTRQPQYIKSLSRDPTSDYRDRVAVVRTTEILAKRIQRRQFPLDVVIL